MRWRARAAATTVGCVAVAALAWACTNANGPPMGKGDTVYHDVDATNVPYPPQPDAGETDSPYGTTEDAYGSYTSAARSVCNQCACEAGTYCFGGATGYTTFSGSCSGGGSDLALGCRPLPACAGDADICGCIFAALRPEVSCYLNCQQTAAPTVFCPNP
jgi:hypothetical protein